jgi:hypothetical protein
MDISDKAPETWRKSSRCVGGDCVEVSFGQDEVALRDSKNIDAGILRLSGDDWAAFIDDIRAGRFDRA